MTILMFARERTNNDKYNSKDEMWGFFASLRMTTVGGDVRENKHSKRSDNSNSNDTATATTQQQQQQQQIPTG
jgi:hypothetical protein